MNIWDSFSTRFVGERTILSLKQYVVQIQYFLKGKKSNVVHVVVCLPVFDGNKIPRHKMRRPQGPFGLKGWG